MCLLQESLIPEILIHLIVKSMYHTPQNITETPFRSPIPPIAQFDFLGIKPEKSKKLSKILITSITFFVP